MGERIVTNTQSIHYLQSKLTADELDEAVSATQEEAVFFDLILPVSSSFAGICYDDVIITTADGCTYLGTISDVGDEFVGDRKVYLDLI